MIEPKHGWPNTHREEELTLEILKLEEAACKFPWYVFGCGICTGNLIFTLLIFLFGGS